MEFEWDEAKRQNLINDRNVDLLYAARIFSNPVLTRIDDRQEYGEERFISLGVVDDECFIVVYTKREHRIRLITAWKGGRRDYERYQTRINGRD